MGYSRRTSNYFERMTLFDLTNWISMVDIVAISVKTLKIDNRCSFEKEFTKLIHMNS